MVCSAVLNNKVRKKIFDSVYPTVGIVFIVFFSFPTPVSPRTLQPVWKCFKISVYKPNPSLLVDILSTNRSPRCGSRSWWRHTKGWMLAWHKVFDDFFQVIYRDSNVPVVLSLLEVETEGNVLSCPDASDTYIGQRLSAGEV